MVTFLLEGTKWWWCHCVQNISYTCKMSLTLSLSEIDGWEGHLFSLHHHVSCFITMKWIFTFASLAFPFPTEMTPCIYSNGFIGGGDVRPPSPACRWSEWHECWWPWLKKANLSCLPLTKKKKKEQRVVVSGRCWESEEATHSSSSWCLPHIPRLILFNKHKARCQQDKLASILPPPPLLTCDGWFWATSGPHHHPSIFISISISSALDDVAWCWTCIIIFTFMIMMMMSMMHANGRA